MTSLPGKVAHLVDEVEVLLFAEDMGSSSVRQPYRERADEVGQLGKHHDR
jgi:hypothetical protein